MSMADNIKNGVKKHRQGISSEQELRDLINSAASKSLKQFIQRLESGEVPIDNISDFVRVLGAYKEINDISSTLEGSGSQASLPQIGIKQEKALDEVIESGKIISDEEGMLDVSDLSVEDVSELIREYDIAKNKENEGTF